MDIPKMTLVASLLGIASTAVFFTFNTTINYLTMPALLLGAPPKTEIEKSSKFLVPATNTPSGPISNMSRQWQEIYFRGHRMGPGLMILSGATLGAATYWANQRLARQLFGLAAITAVSVIPYTLIFMAPTNNELHRRSYAITKGSRDMKDLDASSTLSLVANWIALNKGRAAISLFATYLGLAGLSMTA